MAELTQTPGVKVNYLIRRRPGITRDQLIAHWFAHHMPIVVENQLQAYELGRNHAFKYIATLFQPRSDGSDKWDGMAQLWFEEALRKPATPHGTKPTDSFQERAEPYMPWATREYVIIDGDLGAAPLSLNDPYPTTRSGFYKRTFLVSAVSNADFDNMFDHWLTRHVPNVKETLGITGGFRYCVSLSIDPDDEPYAGLAELYFHEESGWRDYCEEIQSDGLEQYVDTAKTLSFGATTEMIGIP